MRNRRSLLHLAVILGTLLTAFASGAAPPAEPTTPN